MGTTVAVAPAKRKGDDTTTMAQTTVVTAH
jgi:hypothetical protein